MPILPLVSTDAAARSRAPSGATGQRAADVARPGAAFAGVDRISPGHRRRAGSIAWTGADAGAPAGGTQILLAPPRRISLAAAGTAHLSAIAGFTTSTLGAYGAIVARRVR